LGFSSHGAIALMKFSLFLVCSVAWAIPPPVVFFTDLTSGPKVGGENNNGTILTICGKNFGATRGASTVTIGGGAVTAYIAWGTGLNATRICVAPNRNLDGIQVAIGASAATGPVVVTVGGVASNNDVTFTVKTWSSTHNRIFCISTGGSDSHNGQFTTDTRSLAGSKGCWQHFRATRAHLASGDILYFGTASDTYTTESGLDPCGEGTFFLKTQLTPCPRGAPSVVDGTASQPIALVGYPGAAATIGGAGPTFADNAIKTYPPVRSGGMLVPVGPVYWDISSLHFIVGTMGAGGIPNPSGGISGLAINGSTGWRLVNNEIECPLCENFSSGGLGIGVNHSFVSDAGPATPISVKILGNYIHNYKAGPPPDTTGWRHTMCTYLGTDANEVEFAWNECNGGAGYSSLGLHVHSSPTSTSPPDGFPIWGLNIHDNLFIDTPAGNDLSLIDPGKGSGVSMFNNLYIHQGDCLDYPNSTTNPGGWQPNGYRRNSTHAFGQGSNDEYWLPVSGVFKIFNNTYYDTANCTGTIGNDGILDVINPVGNSRIIYNQPPNVTVCSPSTSVCTAHLSGTLPIPAAPRYLSYAAYNVGFQLTSGSTTVQFAYDDGAGNLLKNGTKVGTFNYPTGAYDITWTGSVPSSYSANYVTILGYQILFQNNLVWLRGGGSPSTYLSGTAYMATPAKVTGDHNLFYTVGGQTVPSVFTSNIGSNSDPLFVNTGTLGAVPSNGDYHIQAGSPAVGTGTATAAVRDYDGLARVSPYSVGAFQLPTAGIDMSPAPLATTIGASYSYQAIASGTNLACGTWTKAGGTLPTGLSVNASGLISGTVGGSAGPFTFTLSCIDSTPTTYTSGTFSITVKAAPQ
jgi:hypothetical protein